VRTDPARRLDEVDRVVVVLVDAVATANTFGSMMMSSAGSRPIDQES